MSISLALIPAAILLKVVLFDKDYEQLIEQDKKFHRNISLPTNYTDKELLIKTLNEYNAIRIKIERENISCQISEYQLKFLKKDENYMVSLSKVKNPQKLIEELRCLDGLYKQNLQEQVYIKTKERVKEQGMRIESETILEDNSIVLTVSV